MKLNGFNKKYEKASRLDRIALIFENLNWLCSSYPDRFKELVHTIIPTFNQYLEFNSSPDPDLTEKATQCLCCYLRMFGSKMNPKDFEPLVEEIIDFLIHVPNRMIQAEFYSVLCFIELNNNHNPAAVEYGRIAYNLIGYKQLNSNLKTFYSNYGLALIYTKDYENAREILTLGLAKNYDQDKMIAEKLHMHLGLLYRNLKDYQHALEEFITAEALHSENDVSGTVILNINIASIFTFSGEYSKCIERLENNFPIVEKYDIDNSAQLNFIQSFNLYIGCALTLQKFDKSRHGLELMEHYIDKYNIQGYMEDFFRLAADDACSRGDFDSALSIYDNAYKIQKQSDSNSPFFLMAYSNFLLYMKKYEQVLNINKEFLSLLNKNSEDSLFIKSYENQIQAHKALGNFKEALDLFEKIFEIQNKSANNDLKQQVEELIRKNKLQQKQLNEKEKRISLFNRSFVQQHNINFVGTSRAIKDVIEKAVIAAQHPDINVLVYGESGTGKELIAKFIHYTSQVDPTVFQEVNCSAIPETMLESEFFGYKKGAFTGAVKDNPGFISSADKGTLFLDEIGDLPLTLQPKLLKVLEEKTFTPLGENKAKKVKFRLISATNKNLIDMIKKSKFRDDLFNRINSLTIEIPPLRKRKADIIPLVDHFLKNFTKEFNMLIPDIDDKTKDLLLSYSYPGNIRELKNIIERTMIFVRQGESFYDSLKKHGFIYNYNSHSDLNEETNALFSSETLNIETVEKQLIIKALEITGNHKSKAAKLLDITPSALTRRLAKFNISAN